MKIKWSAFFLWLGVITGFVGINSVALAETTNYDAVALWIGFNAGTLCFISLFGAMIAAEMERWR